MLQQTQVGTVISYYSKFLQKFPTISDLAQGSLDEVLCIWAGMGYYRRARFLHKAAIYIQEHHDGVIPSEECDLLKVPGVGKYTCGAIRSIAFNIPAAAVDGNVARILSRVFALDTPKQEPLWNAAKRLVDIKEGKASDYIQALFDFGSGICKVKTPKCHDECCLKELCLAFKEMNVGQENIKTKTEGCEICQPGKREDLSVTYYPVKIKKKPPRSEERKVVIMSVDDRVLVQRPTVTAQKKKDSQVLAELWELPLLQMNENEMDNLIPKTQIKHSKSIGTIKHIFSHIHQTLHIYHLSISHYTPKEDEQLIHPDTLLLQGEFPTSERTRKVIRYWLKMKCGKKRKTVKEDESDGGDEILDVGLPTKRVLRERA